MWGAFRTQYVYGLRYPVPLFLLVKYKAGDNKDYQYDVIDGLQRLDALSAAQSHKEHYGVTWVEYKRCYVTGVESEMKKYWKNDADTYKGFICSVVEKEPIRL